MATKKKSTAKAGKKGAKAGKLKLNRETVKNLSADEIKKTNKMKYGITIDPARTK